MSQPKGIKRKREPFPVLLFLILLGSVYFFWFSPFHREPRPVDIQPAKSASSSTTPAKSTP